MLITSFNFALAGLTFSSEVVNLVVLFQSLRIFQGLGGIILGSRLLNLIPAGYVLACVYWSESPRFDRYDKRLLKAPLAEKWRLYGGVAFFTLVDALFCADFSWRKSDTVLFLGGFPDLTLYLYCKLPRLAMTVISIAAQVTVFSISFGLSVQSIPDGRTTAILALHSRVL